MKSFKATCDMFKIIEVEEKIYECVTNSKNPIREDTNHASHGRNLKGGEAASPTNPEKVRDVKRKTKNIGHPSDRPNGGKICLLHGPRQYMED